MSSTNTAAFLDAKATALRIGPATMPTAGPNEIIVRNRAVAINPVDWHMQDAGIFVQEWPGILGSDVAGEVSEVGSTVTRFKIGDRVVGHAITLVTGQARDGAFQLFSVVLEDKAAILPGSVTYTAAAVLPLAMETAIAGLMLPEPGIGVFNLPTPAMALPLPQLHATDSHRTVVVYGASSSVGSMAVQLAKAGGSKVIAVTSPKNFALAKQCGAAEVFDYNDSFAVDKVVLALKQDANIFAGIFDAIATAETYKFDLELLERMGGGHLATTHPPPENVLNNVQAGMVLGVTDYAATVWRSFVTPALEAGHLQCLPKQEVVGRGLEALQAGLDKSRAGVSGTKLVIEL